MSRALTALSIAVSSWLFLGCVPSSDGDHLDDSIVITKQAKGTDFGSYQTFFLRPEIRSFDDEGEPTTLDPETAAPLLEATQNNLTRRGYVAVATQAEAELGVELVYADQITTTYWCYYWYDYYYWGYPGWGYYPYYGGCDATVWRSGMLGTIILDLSEAQQGGGAGGAGNVPALIAGVWFSGVYGVGLNSVQARDGINQAFTQSPYLKAAP
jgi:hypothetical protein